MVYDSQGRERYDIDVESVAIGLPDEEGRFPLTIRAQRPGVMGARPMSIELQLDREQARHLRRVLRSGLILLRVQSSQWPGSDEEA